VESAAAERKAARAKAPVLYHIENSHYNEKARWALDYMGIPHVRKAPPPDESERRRALQLEEHFDEQLGPYIRRWLFHEGLVSLPSGDFIEGALGSAPRAVKTTMRVTAPVGRRILRLRYGINEAVARVARDKTAAALDRIEAELQPSGYLVADRFSVADLTAAALVFQLVGAREAPYLLPPPLPPAVERFRAEASGRRAFEWVTEMYRRHRGRSAEIPG
jgi:glutathione S-transferase